MSTAVADAPLPRSLAPYRSLASLVRLPPAVPSAVYANESLRFLHIIKTGGESLEHYLAGQPMPKLDFSTCRTQQRTVCPKRYRGQRFGELTT